MSWIVELHGGNAWLEVDLSFEVRPSLHGRGGRKWRLRLKWIHGSILIKAKERPSGLPRVYHHDAGCPIPSKVVIVVVASKKTCTQDRRSIFTADFDLRLGGQQVAVFRYIGERTTSTANFDLRLGCRQVAMFRYIGERTTSTANFDFRLGGPQVAVFRYIGERTISTADFDLRLGCRQVAVFQFIF